MREPADEARLLRFLLFVVHPCPTKSSLPVMVCRDCGIDFSADTPAQIYGRYCARSLEWANEHQWDVCSRCRVQRFTYEATAPCHGNAGHDWVTTIEAHPFDGGDGGGLIECVTCGGPRDAAVHGVTAPVPKGTES